MCYRLHYSWFLDFDKNLWTPLFCQGIVTVWIQLHYHTSVTSLAKTNPRFTTFTLQVLNWSWRGKKAGCMEENKNTHTHTTCGTLCSKWTQTWKDTGGPSMPHRVMPSQYLCLYEHTPRQTVLTRLTLQCIEGLQQKVLGGDGVLSCCSITDGFFWHDHIVLTVYTALMMATWWMISHTANSAKPFSYCFSKQRSPVILITVDVLFFFMHKHCNFPTTKQWKFSHTSQLQYHPTCPQLC